MHSLPPHASMWKHKGQGSCDPPSALSQLEAHGIWNHWRVSNGIHIDYSIWKNNGYCRVRNLSSRVCQCGTHCRWMASSIPSGRWERRVSAYQWNSGCSIALLNVASDLVPKFKVQCLTKVSRLLHSAALQLSNTDTFLNQTEDTAFALVKWALMFGGRGASASFLCNETA